MYKVVYKSLDSNYGGGIFATYRFRFLAELKAKRLNKSLANEGDKYVVVFFKEK